MPTRNIPEDGGILKSICGEADILSEAILAKDDIQTVLEKFF